jgi:predicted HAD superfamily Cof-like phosphohydrolase
MRQATRDMIAFNFKYGHLTAPAPSIPDDRVVHLRERLIDEEVTELLEAMDDGDLPAIAKEACDVIVVVVGTMLAYGLDPAAAWAAVMASNMSKGTEKDAMGKTLKNNPEYRPADMAGVLAAQGPLGLAPAAVDPAALDSEDD